MLVTCFLLPLRSLRTLREVFFCPLASVFLFMLPFQLPAQHVANLIHGSRAEFAAYLI